MEKTRLLWTLVAMVAAILLTNILILISDNSRWQKLPKYEGAFTNPSVKYSRVVTVEELDSKWIAEEWGWGENIYGQLLYGAEDSSVSTSRTPKDTREFAKHRMQVGNWQHRDLGRYIAECLMDGKLVVFIDSGDSGVRVIQPAYYPGFLSMEAAQSQ